MGELAMTTGAAYEQGLQDGALSALAPALGVEPGEGQPTHTLMGRRFTVHIEWLDGPLDSSHEDIARRLAEHALARITERAGR